MTPNETKSEKLSWGIDLSQKYILAPFHTESGGLITSRLKLLLPILLGFGRKHLNTIELASCVVYVICGFTTLCLKTTRNFSLP